MLFHRSAPIGQGLGHPHPPALERTGTLVDGLVFYAGLGEQGEYGAFDAFANLRQTSGLIHTGISPAGYGRYRSDQSSNLQFGYFDRYAFGTGPFTCAVYGNLDSTANAQNAIGNNGGANQWRLLTGYNEGAGSAGAITLFCYDGGTSQIGVAAAITAEHPSWYVALRDNVGTLQLWRDGILLREVTGQTARNVTASGATVIGMGHGVANSTGRGITRGAVWRRALRPAEIQLLPINPDRLTVGSRTYFDVTAGPVIVTTSASGRLRGRASAVVAPTRTASSAGRERAVGAVSWQPIKTVAAVGRERARGSNATTPISIVSAVGRRRARGSTSASQVAPGIVVTSAVGRERVRGSNTATSIRTVAVVGRRRARGADAASSIRAQLAAGRVRARGTTTAAPIVAGTVVTSAVGRRRVRGSSSCTTTRVTALAGRVRARGSDAVAGFRVVAVAGRRRARGAASAGPAGVLVDSIAASRLWVRGTTAAVAMPPLVLVPGRVCIGARQPASVAINASILACDCN